MQRTELCCFLPSPPHGSACFSPPWKVFWIKITSTGVLPVPQHQKQTELNAYILFPEVGLSLELPGPVADSC